MPLLFANARSKRAVINYVSRRMHERMSERMVVHAPNPCSFLCKFWSLSRKVRNAIVHALVGNGSVDWWWCFDQLDSSQRPSRAEYKKHIALLKCDDKLVQRMADAGQNAKAVLILAGAAKRYGLGWDKTGSSVPKSSASYPAATVQPEPVQKPPAPKSSGKGKGVPKTSPSPKVAPNGPPNGKGKGGSADQSRRTATAGSPGRAKPNASGWTRAIPKPDDVKYSLETAEWNVPQVEELVPGKPGIRFCATQECAREQIRKLKETSAPAAILVKDRLQDRTDEEQVVFQVIKGTDGESQRVAVWGFLYNLGKGKVEHKSDIAEITVEGKSRTITLLAETTSDFVDTACWTGITEGKLGSFRKVIYGACAEDPAGLQRTDVVDVFKLAKAGKVASVIVRLKADAVEKAMRASGKHGVFFRPLGSLAQQYQVTWLKGELAHNAQAANEQVKQLQANGALGLALRPGGLGIRATCDRASELRDALGRGPAQTRWLVSNVSWECSDTDVAEILQAATWDATPLHPLRTRGGAKASATWVVSANAPPPKTMWKVKLANHETFVISAQRLQQRRPALKTWESRKTTSLNEDAVNQAPKSSTNTWADLAKKLPPASPPPSDKAPGGFKCSSPVTVRPTPPTSSLENRMATVEGMLQDILAKLGGSGSSPVRAKRQRTSGEKPPENIRICQLEVSEEELSETGTLERVVGDGSCLYHALASILSSYPSEYSAVKLRRQLQDALSVRAWRNTVAPFLDEDVDEWSSKQAKDRQWGDEVSALVLVCQLARDRPLYIYEADEGKNVLYHISWDGQDSTQVPVVLWYAEGHYDAFHLDAASVLPAVYEDIAAWKATMAGGYSASHN